MALRNPSMPYDYGRPDPTKAMEPDRQAHLQDLYWNQDQPWTGADQGDISQTDQGMAQVQAVLDQASQPDPEDFSGFDPQSVDLGQLLSGYMKNDMGSLEDINAMAANAISGKKSYGDYLNEAKARKITEMNALTQQLQVEMAIAQAMQPQQADLPSAIQEALFAAGGDERMAQELLRGKITGKDAGPKPTDDMREYELAKSQGFQGSFLDFVLEQKKAGSASTTINVGPTGVDYGDPEKGLVWARNPDGTVKLDERGAPIGVPYQGGSVYREEATATDKRATRELQRQKYGSVLVEDADRAITIAETSEWPTTGTLGWLSSAVPGTPAYDMARLIETITANVGFDRLQEMRAASPTGGALGQVSNFENQLLQSVLGSLKQSQTKEQFVYNMKRVKALYERIIHQGVSENDPLAQDILDDPAIAPVFKKQGGFDPYSEFGLEPPENR